MLSMMAPVDDLVDLGPLGLEDGEALWKETKPMISILTPSKTDPLVF